MAGISLGGFALIVGTGGGIGEETAFTLAESGVAGIAFATRTAGKAEKSAEESKQYATNPRYRTLAIQVDITEPASVQSMMDRVVDEFGRVDYCINAAGVDVEKFHPFMDVSVEDYDNVMAINSKGMFLVTQAAMRVMSQQSERQLQSGRHGTRSLGRGAIVNIMSAASHMAIPNRSSYITSRHASLGMMRAAALDHDRTGVRVNAICPSWVRTPMFYEEKRRNPMIEDYIKAAVPAGRPMEPVECAESVLFLCSPGSMYMNGVSLIEDSGTTLSVRMGP